MGRCMHARLRHQVEGLPRLASNKYVAVLILIDSLFQCHLAMIDDGRQMIFPATIKQYKSHHALARR